jgi:hypothetical protein
LVCQGQVAYYAHPGAMPHSSQIQTLVVDGPGWSFIKKFDKTKDGRDGILVLKTQAKGALAKLTRKQAAYAKLASST